MYYRLGTDGLENTYMELEPGLNGHIELSMGRSWDIAKDEIDLPFKYTMTVDEGESPVLYAWYPGSDLMEERLVQVLQKAGVDNLQTYPTEVAREGTGEVVPGYITVNILGRISCAVVGESEVKPLLNRYYFENLVIDPKRTHDQAIFRLDESSMVVLVHERIAKAITAEGFRGLTLEPVKESQ